MPELNHVMRAVNPVMLTIADGVERQLRWSLGTRKRFKERFGTFDIAALTTQHGDEIVPEIAYLMMFDANGQPPPFSLDWFTETMPPEAMEGMMTVIFSALIQGAKSPNEILAALQEVTQASQNTETATGSTSGPSAEPASDSQTGKSGTDYSNVKSMPSPVPIESKSEAEPS